MARQQDELDVQTYLDYTKEFVFNNDIVVFNKFVQAIKDSQALVAGGSVLKSYARYYSKNTDIDIYVNISKANILFNKLIDIDFIYKNHCLAPAYDQSFFMKNNILSRFRLVKYANQLNNTYIDLMIIPDNVPLRNVVQNFDLTFCEIWFDGEKVFATNKEDILQKKGTLREEYQQSFLENLNLFIIKRIQKYISRGFKIKYECNGDKTISKPQKSVSEANKERWVVTFLYSKLFQYDMKKNQIQPNDFFELFIKNKLQEFKMNKLKDVIMNYSSLNIRPNNDEELKKLYINILIYNIQYLPQKYIDYIIEFTGIRMDDISGDPKTNIINAFLNAQPDENIEDIKRNINMRKLQSDKKLLYLFSSLKNAFIDKNNFNFDTYIVDETQLPRRCNDIINLDEEDIEEYIKDKDNIMFVNVSPAGLRQPPNDVFSAICYTKENLKNYINSYDNIFYKCSIQNSFIDYNNDQIIEGVIVTGRTHEEMPYIKLPLLGGTNILFPLYKIWKVLESDKKVFYIFPREELNYTVSHDVSYNEGNYLSANHCQEGSRESVYDIKICGGNNCFIGL